MHLADLTSYVKAQEQAGALYRQPDAWARRAIVNVGAFRQVLQRPHDHGVRPRHLEGRGVSGGPTLIPCVNNNDLKLSRRVHTMPASDKDLTISLITTGI